MPYVKGFFMFNNRFIFVFVSSLLIFSSGRAFIFSTTACAPSSNACVKKHVFIMSDHHFFGSLEQNQKQCDIFLKDVLPCVPGADIIAEMKFFYELDLNTKSYDDLLSIITKNFSPLWLDGSPWSLNHTPISKIATTWMVWQLPLRWSMVTNNERYGCSLRSCDPRLILSLFRIELEGRNDYGLQKRSLHEISKFVEAFIERFQYSWLSFISKEASEDAFNETKKMGNDSFLSRLLTTLVRPLVEKVIMDKVIPDVTKEMIYSLYDDCKKISALECGERLLCTFSSALRKRCVAVVMDSDFLVNLVELEAFRMILKSKASVAIVIVGNYHVANLVKLLETVGISPIDQNWKERSLCKKIHYKQVFNPFFDYVKSAENH